MTKKKSLELCKRLWQWLSEHPGESKSDWPRFKDDDLGDMLHFCPCCEYVWHAATALYGQDNFNMDQSCLLCPLLEYWIPTKMKALCVMGRCEEPRSPYAKWKRVSKRYVQAIKCGSKTTRDAQLCTKYAQEIVSYCDCELAKLLQEESITNEETDSKNSHRALPATVAMAGREPKMLEGLLVRVEEGSGRIRGYGQLLPRLFLRDIAGK